MDDLRQAGGIFLKNVTCEIDLCLYLLTVKHFVRAGISANSNNEAQYCRMTPTEVT